MKKRIICTFICMLMIALSLQIPTTALSDNNVNAEIKKNVNEDSISLKPLIRLTTGVFDDVHEITDPEGDTPFDYIDVVWASFYENSNEPEYLYAALKISNLRDITGCVYAIHWYFDNVHYDVGFHNGIISPYREFKTWSSGCYPKQRYIDTWNDSLNSGSFDLQNDIIIWKVHKSCIGSPQPGDILTHSSVLTAQSISINRVIQFGRFSKFFSDHSDPLESIDYIIQF